MNLRRIPALFVLFWVVIADYLAQIPYYLVNYYIPHHALPTPSSVVLLGLTLAWFLIGYFALRARRRYGYWLLVSFLAVEGLFYLNTLIFGGAVLQLNNPSLAIRAVFVVGYVTGIVSLIYAVALVIFRSRLLATRQS
jgi:hypothetical protein